jgi:release factor glutamine methyltransferase
MAYITGSREFWSLDLRVTPATLIPRPETELLVARALDHLPAARQQKVADLGTGSGAIAIAIASERPLTQVIASDRSQAALAVAGENIERHGLKNVSTAQGDWFQALPKDSLFHLIASNPPYVETNDPHLQHNGLPWEPQSALTAGADGLDDIRTLTAQAQRHLSPGGWLLLEHGCDQGSQVQDLMLRAGFEAIKTQQDLAGRDRLTEGRKPAGAA